MGRVVVAVHDKGGCELRPLAGHDSDPVIALDACSKRFVPRISTWSANGRYLALAGPGQVFIADPATGKTVAAVAGQLLGWSQADPYLALLHNGAVKVIDPRGQPIDANRPGLRFWIEPDAFSEDPPSTITPGIASVSPDLRHIVRFSGECRVGKYVSACNDIALHIVPTTEPQSLGLDVVANVLASYDRMARMFEQQAHERATGSTGPATSPATEGTSAGLRLPPEDRRPTRVLFGHLREPTMVAWAPDGRSFASIAGVARVDRFFSNMRPEEDHSVIVSSVPRGHLNPGGWHRQGMVPIGPAVEQSDDRIKLRDSRTFVPETTTGLMPLLHLPSAAGWGPEEDVIWVGFDYDDCTPCRHSSQPLPTQAFHFSTGLWSGPFWLSGRTLLFDADGGSVGPFGRLSWPFKGYDAWAYIDDDQPTGAWRVEVILNDGTHHVLNHPGLVSTARWSPDGRRVLTACQDGFSRIWDGMTGRLLAEIDFPDRSPGGGRYPVDMADWSPSGRWVLLFSAVGGLQIEASDLVGLIEIAHQRLVAAPPRGLTRETLDKLRAPR